MGGNQELFQALGSPPTLSGSYTYDSSSAPTSNPPPDFIHFRNFNSGSDFVIPNATINVGVYEATLVSNIGNVSNGVTYLIDPSKDQYQGIFFLNGSSGNTNPLPASYAFYAFTFVVDGVTGTYNGTTLVTPSIDTLFPPPPFHLQFLRDNSVIELSGRLTNLALAPVPVPEPPAVILLGAGLVALIGLGARSWRQKRPSLT